MFAGQVFGSRPGVLDIGGEPLLTISLQASCRVFQLVERRFGVGGCGAPGPGRCTAHVRSRVLKPPSCVRQLLVVVLTRQDFEAAGRLFGILGELTLSLGTRAARRASLLGGGPALPFCLLLLPPGEFLQGLHLLFDLSTGLLALTAFDGLVLVLKLIELELEDIGQVVRSRAAAAAALLPLTDLYLITLLGLLEILERFQLGRDRFL